MNGPVMRRVVRHVLAAAAVALPLAAAACERRLEVTGVVPAGGPVMVAIYDDEAGFMRRTVATLRLDPVSDTLRGPLCGPTAPRIAVVAFQDRNGNGSLDRNLFGMPTEPWGRSGSPGGGAPTWSAAQVDAGQPSIRIPLSR